MFAWLVFIFSVCILPLICNFEKFGISVFFNKLDGLLVFLYLYPFFAYQPPRIGQVSKSLQSAHISNFLSLKQQILILHFALLISRSPVSKPNLHPLQYSSIYGLQVLQYAPQQPIYLFAFSIICIGLCLYA